MAQSGGPATIATGGKCIHYHRQYNIGEFVQAVGSGASSNPGGPAGVDLRSGHAPRFSWPRERGKRNGGLLSEKKLDRNRNKKAREEVDI